MDFKYQGKAYNCRDGETLLDAAIRQGINLVFSCRAGVCHTCLQRSMSGAPPKAAQKGLKPSLVERDYFLACLCKPSHQMEFSAPDENDLYFSAILAAREKLADDIFRLSLEPGLNVTYRPGQFINLRREDGLTRCYSIASVPGEDYFLELHVKRKHGGQMSNWLLDDLAVGAEVKIQGANGGCHFDPQTTSENLLLVATGTGLAPLLGIARDALATGYKGQVYLYHGSSKANGLYLIDQIRHLEMAAANFHYTPCVSGEIAPADHQQGRAHDIAFAKHPDLQGWRVHLAGNPNMVDRAAALALKAGVDEAELFMDPFLLKDLRAVPRPVINEGRAASDAKAREILPDPEMWAALQDGHLLTAILTDFYSRAFDDPVLSPYFANSTRQRLIEKVHSFMKAIFTGQKCFFGNRPRNAHHWMVISDEIFDYREALKISCMRRHGLAEHLIARWCRIEESYRDDIVKAKPFGRTIDGVELPVDGFDQIKLSIGALCDSCARVLDEGEEVSYHLRSGHIYCSHCHISERHAPT